MADVVTAEAGIAPTIAAPHVPARPQPLGAFPLPAGLLLVPGGPDTEQARADLVAGRLPAPWPDRLRAHELALAGRPDAALAALTGDDPVTRYNRFVIDPDHAAPGGTALDEAALATLRADLGPALGVLVDVVRFTLGRSDTAPPSTGADGVEVDGELAALVLSAQAGDAVAAGDPDRATALLRRAAGLVEQLVPPSAAVLLGAAAEIDRDRLAGGAADPVDPVTAEPVIAELTRALSLLADTDLRIGRAELHLQRGLLRHELSARRPELLTAAVHDYHAALQLALSTEAPLTWAAAHANLAAAYLTMPMVEAGDQLRLGVAVRSLRSALTVYTRDEHPAQWASTQLNLANALVYAPSTHQGDNLVEAVELYEAVLAVRDRQADPVGRARVLANQGNALAHLGMFDHAKAKLYEARFLFEELQDGDAVRAVRGVLDEIARQVALSRDATGTAG
jgi:hypothetical protein